MRFTVEIKRNQNEMTEVGEKGKRRGEKKKGEDRKKKRIEIRKGEDRVE